MRPLLQVDHLCKDFRTGGPLGRRAIRVVDDVSLEVLPGEMLGLVGESGCGKTTLARCSIRLLEPTAGAVSFDGCDLLALSATALRARRREFQMIFQDASASLNPHMTLGQILSEPFAAHRMGTRSERESWVRALMEAVALEGGLIGRKPGELSGGQQQRLVIARALAFKPRLLIADEPVSAMDASVQAQILNLLSDIRRRFALTLILISHSLPVTHYLCSRVAVMYLGRLVEESPAAEFFQRPRHPYSQALLECMPGLDLTAADLKPGIRGEIPSPANPPAGCRFHPRCPAALEHCRAERPAMTALDAGSKVACFLYSPKRETSSPGGSSE